MWNFIIVCGLIGFLDLSSAQLVQFGQCNPNIQLVANFDASRFTGKWYGISRTDSTVQSADCSTLELTATGDSFEIANRAYNNNFREDFTGIATLEAGTAKFTFNVSNGDLISDFWLLNTDYTTIALGYACKNRGNVQREVSIWLMGRQPDFATTTQQVLINNTLNNLLGITLNDLRSIEHSDTACYELPNIPPGQPIILDGQCDANTAALQNFDPARFQGTWHTIGSYYSANQNERGTCGRAQYTLTGGVVEVVNSEVIDQALRTIKGSAVVSSTDGSARLNVTLEVVPGVFNSAELWVLGSDYDNYAVSYTCVNLPNNQKRVNSWILSRTRTISSSGQAGVDAIIASRLDLNEQYFSKTDQSNEGCFYFPEAEAGRPVVFRGQCDMSIPAMADFNATKYLGKWHNIESYPSVWGGGDCNNAYYSLGDGVVDVLNSQVIDQKLHVMRGFAVVASTDGTAKLKVTFNVAGSDRTIDYWVLSTDYISYSLVYTCSNLNDDEMQVWSWKLSRTKQLTPAANTTINAVVDTVKYLDARYYWGNDQSDAKCFYYPEPQPGVPVRFPGKCDTTIPVVNNFNMASFLGTWYEYQAYPKEQQTGQCISHAYTVGTGNTLNVVSSSITDQFLGLSNGVLSFGGIDGSGRLVLTMRTEAGDVSFPFWILSVNYNDYAFAYSCVELEHDHKAIYSWKLSRTKGSLSAAAAANINSIISNHVVLGQEYYEDIDQSADACFALPDLQPGAPVIIPGQCNPNVPVVQNFNATAYTGTWRLIESYPAAAQTGACNDATYTLDGSTVIVYNTQVINQALSTITGTAVLASTDGSAKLLVNFPNGSQSEYWVLDTDYESYALVYTCENLNAQERRVWSWKLSRTETLTANAQANINRVVDSVQVLNNRFYQKVDRSDAACFYFPEPNPSTPVIFRGRCDESISVVQNFNAVAYMNQWYDIESYPTGFQGGTCNNAFYTLVDGAVDVYNTQVIDQQLRTINGIARVASTDGSAKLEVTFPVAGVNVTTNYWVLATDYTNFALVYTCVNLEGNRRQVYSWKLSRTKSLSANANSAINAVVAGVQVLSRPQYYIQRDQSPAGCFYVPEPEPGVPVVFPGQCDNTIQAVPNFNLTGFEGVWHEIETYPKDQQTGQCVNHRYVQGSGNNFNLESTSVLGRMRNITSSTAALTSTDGSGRLTITIPSATDTIPFWIIDTDYTDYALAYSCVNIRDDFRAVYSWKLSRSKQLSAQAEQKINAKIQNANIEVLRTKYFEKIDQTDEACFYIPQFIPGQPAIFPGQCNPNIPVVQNFNASGYADRWRLIESYPTFWQEGTCQEATYVLNDGGVDVFNTQVIRQQLDTMTGTAVVASTDGSAKLLVTFPTSPTPAPYWVLDTDYDSYALVYSCSNLNSEQRLVFSWKLSRERDLSQTAITNINKIVESIDVLDDSLYQITDQSDNGCFYLPQPDVTRPVIFRGRCDQSIPVVQNFDAVRYMNQWYDIESYPTGFQEGTCNNAFYTLVDGEVDVYNTQVVEQRLDTINGIARVASTDGSAKLQVTFPVVGTNFTITTDYWVLATDYTSYAYVYTCIDLDDERRQVYSWKLSREKQLSSAAQTAINAVAQQIPVLNQNYYIKRDQSPEGCFYFPEPEPGKPVVFPGTCDVNVQAQANFNLESFKGLWHEVEAYPKDQQTGQCINHEYTEGAGNTLSLKSTSVLDLKLNVSTGNIAITSNDGSGRLTIVITVDGSPVTIPFWVLDTDYNDYALAYGCVDISADFRAVYSWKLSRTKQLSPAANISITNSMSKVDVLQQKYYENIDQSDKACFYLPDLGPGEPAVFRGQCDRYIPVVQNFDPVRYTGRWRLIESYSAEFQNGSCNDATYTLSNDTVLVHNTKVNDQLLQTIDGTAVLASTDGSAKLLVTFPGSPEPAEYWVLATDYESFALVYSCRNINSESRRVWSWKLSRTRDLTPSAVTTINTVVNSIDVLENKYYERVDHSDAACFYYPIPDGKPVSFRGQCDESIPVVTNFNPTRYMGKWYDIESYPQAFQDGTCPTATYNLTTDGVDVFNTQVVRQQLDTIFGLAVPATTDDSAKLTVSFPIAGTDLVTNTPYWVLATDYDSYSFVYSCTNDGDDKRKVTTWKLSRGRSLTPGASNAISAVMATVPVLRQQYYLARGHSDEDCFYYPDNNGGPVILDGQCPNTEDVEFVTNFNVDNFKGSWFEVSRFPSDLQDGECTENSFTLNGTDTFMLTQTIVYKERLVTVSGPVVAAPDGRGILSAKLTGSGVTIEKIMYVLSVDYNDHALIMSCNNYDSNRKQIYSWKLARSRSGFSNASNTAIAKVVDSNKDLFEGYYKVTDQTNRGCFYYPVFTQPPTEINLLGNCDESIRAIPNFNATAYLGRWFEIARYPVRFQSGACNRAEYILDSDAVRVLNSQVVNKKLDIMIGSAVVASTDGSGILNVSFAFSDGSVNFANYYVMDTDYTSYSLVYSCRNTGDRRLVSSWKLSRSRSLNNDVLTIMDNIISDTEGLIQDYYTDTRQDEDACFYIPEANRDEAPQFRGQCQNVTGVQNFNAQRYVGWWHEIERYPSDTDVGVCISSDFRASGNQYQVVDTNIFDVTAQVKTSTVVVSDDGKLTKTVDGETVEIWVLATDYETYALLYSCENINDEYMRVWSAKHSKTRSLSDAAQTAMVPVIQDNRVLLPEFYLQVDQSDSACFHYPEQTGTRIILPGQCKDDIPVVQSFDVGKYSGVWYQMERYPQNYESGDCTGARYTYNENSNIVTVVNWQVINGTLDRLEGWANLSSTDGSARLRVRLPVRGTNETNPPMSESDLWVLTTDYNTYSLAYSCVNVDDKNRAVGSWKLSRTRTMPATGTEAINSYMATREELHQPYFNLVPQREDCPSSAILVRISTIIMLVSVLLQLLM